MLASFRTSPPTLEPPTASTVPSTRVYVILVSIIRLRHKTSDLPELKDTTYRHEGCQFQPSPACTCLHCRAQVHIGLKVVSISISNGYINDH